MSTVKVHFQINPRLPVLLSEGYRSSEQALKELIDNAWDAEADNVWITLPEITTPDPIIIRDDGAGMTTTELKQEYLEIARNRRERKGNATPNKHRKVKGSKGIGKFSGLFAAEIMELKTSARSVTSAFRLLKENLLAAKKKLSGIDLDVETNPCSANSHGTEIILKGLNQNLRLPTAESMSALLVYEYGREKDFNIFVNGKRIGIDDLPGENVKTTEKLEETGSVSIDMTVTNAGKNPKSPGIALIVAGRQIGKPHFFGLENEQDFPQKILQKVYGEIHADGLLNDISADMGGVIENSKAYAVLESFVQTKVREAAQKVYAQEINLAQARFSKMIKERLSKLPENKRVFAEEAVQRVLNKFYGKTNAETEPIIQVILDALEQDDYRLVLEKIAEASKKDIAHFAEALQEFGLVEMSSMIKQAMQRREFLDYMDQLVDQDSTLESEVHKAVEKNLWVFGNQYAIMSSNKSLASIVEKQLAAKYSGDNETKRPDLLLSSGFDGKHFLIEFKRPKHKIVIDDYHQASKYRLELGSHLSNLSIALIGGSIDSHLRQQQNIEPNTEFWSWKEVIANARTQLEWILKEFSHE